MPRMFVYIFPLCHQRISNGTNCSYFGVNEQSQYEADVVFSLSDSCVKHSTKQLNFKSPGTFANFEFDEVTKLLNNAKRSAYE